MDCRERRASRPGLLARGGYGQGRMAQAIEPRFDGWKDPAKSLSGSFQPSGTMRRPRTGSGPPRPAARSAAGLAGRSAPSAQPRAVVNRLGGRRRGHGLVRRPGGRRRAAGMGLVTQVGGRRRGLEGPDDAAGRPLEGLGGPGDAAKTPPEGLGGAGGPGDAAERPLRAVCRWAWRARACVRSPRAPTVAPQRRQPAIAAAGPVCPAARRHSSSRSSPKGTCVPRSVCSSGPRR
jgi:hypothetical protein